MEWTGIIEISIHSIGGAAGFTRSHFYSFFDGSDSLWRPPAVDLCIHALNLADRAGTWRKLRRLRRDDLLEAFIIEDRLQMLKIIRRQRAFRTLDFRFANRRFLSLFEDKLAIAINHQTGERVGIVGDVPSFAIGDAMDALRMSDIGFEIQIGLGHVAV